MIECTICKSEAESRSLREFDGESVNCPRCGQFRITREASVNWRRFSGEERLIANACGWIREHQEEDITSEQLLFIELMPTPSVHKRAVSLLKLIEKETVYAGEQLIYSGPRWLSVMGVSSSINSAECLYLFRYLFSKGYLEHHVIDPGRNDVDSTSVSITPEGYAYLDQIKYSNEKSQIGFCAMWFNDCIKPVWKDYIEPAIRDAGYEPKRIDEHPHNNRIDDEIIAQIRRSRFVVADFTGQRGGVYFEAGFALGLGLPVIWTCREKELRRVHFDNRQYNFVVWEEDNLPEFKLNLQYRIEATLGRGTWKPST